MGYYVDPKARALSVGLSHDLDVDGNNIIPLDTLREGLTAIDPELFSDDIMDEIVQQMDSSQTNTVTKAEFCDCFCVIAEATSVDDIRAKIEKFKKRKIPQTFLSTNLEYDEDNDFDMDMEAPIPMDANIDSYTASLQEQLKMAHLKLENIKRRYDLVRQEHDISTKNYSQLEVERNQMRKELQRTNQERMKLTQNEAQYRQIVKGMEKRMQKMERELRAAKASKQRRQNSKRSQHPSIVQRMQRYLCEHDSMIKETKEKILQHERILQKTEAYKAKEMEEKYLRLQEDYRELEKKTELTQQELNRQNFLDELGYEPSEMTAISSPVKQERTIMESVTEPIARVMPLETFLPDEVIEEEKLEEQARELAQESERIQKSKAEADKLNRKLLQKNLKLAKEEKELRKMKEDTEKKLREHVELRKQELAKKEEELRQRKLEIG